MLNLLKVVGKGKKRKVQPITSKDVDQNNWKSTTGESIDSQQLLINMLLPGSVKWFLSELENEVHELCGARGKHNGEYYRWGSQQGSVVLGNQKVAIEKPRVRNKKTGEEKTLQKYESFQDPSHFDESVFRDGIRKVSQRDYAEGVPQLASSFGISKSSVSKRWINATKKELEKLQNRSLSDHDIVAVFLDGKRFRDRGSIVALGACSTGEKLVLGIYEASTENSASCIELLNDLESRGLPQDNLIFIVDGGSGLNKALNDKYDVNKPQKRRAVRIRCFKHKAENILSALPEKSKNKAKELIEDFRLARNYQEAREACKALEAYLRKENMSACRSLLEAKDDLLMLHQLELNSLLKRFFSTTNPIESLNYLLEEDLRRVKNWQDSEHFQRWFAASALANEKRMRRIRGYRGMIKVQIKLKELCKKNELDSGEIVA